MNSINTVQRLAKFFAIIVIMAATFLEFHAQENVPDPNNARVDELLDSLTLEQQVAQMFMVSLYGPTLNASGRELLETWQPGGVVLFGGNVETPEQITTLTNSHQAAITGAGGVPLLIATDQEGGWIARLREGFTEWPPMSLLAAADDAALAYEVGQAMARELRAVGLNMNLAPVADLDTNIDNPIIGRRSPGSDTDLLAVMLRGYIQGMQAEGVAATAKHFPGHGDTAEDSHVTLPLVPHDRERLEGLELLPFAAAIEAGTGAIMVGHLWLPEFDPAGPLPATLSPAIVTGLLRVGMGYEGVIMTDAMDMDAIDTNYAADEAALRAVRAGIDLIAYGPGSSPTDQISAMQAIIDAVRSGDIPEERITASARRVLLLKARLGALDWTPLDPATARDRIDVPGTLPLIQTMFEAGVTIAFDNAERIPLRDEQQVGIIYPGQRISINRVCGTYRGDIRWLPLNDFPDASA
ncbi:MAG: glycoside hydrolase family 3 protein, partial [Chloroflexota bacterium]